MKKIFVLTAILYAALQNINAQKSTVLHIINTLRIASAGGWDYIEVGPINDWLYVSHGTQVNIINKKTGDSVGVIENTIGVHGIAFDVANKKGFTSNGKLNNITVFDMNSNKVLSQIPTGQNPDWIFYEPYTKKIVTCNGRGKNLSFIDVAKGIVTDSVAVAGKPETAVSDGKGKIFVNVEDKNEILVIDVKTLKVINHWSLAPAESPTGLAFDVKTNRLFAGCEKYLVVLDANNGKIIEKLPIGDGCDGVVFDKVSKNIYTANGEGTMTVIKEDNANKFTVVENVTTKKSARTIAIDSSTQLLYLPTAEFENMESGAKGRPKMKTGTFQILVVGK